MIILEEAKVNSTLARFVRLTDVPVESLSTKIVWE